MELHKDSLVVRPVVFGVDSDSRVVEMADSVRGHWRNVNSSGIAGIPSFPHWIHSRIINGTFDSIVDFRREYQVFIKPILDSNTREKKRKERVDRFNGEKKIAETQFKRVTETPDYSGATSHITELNIDIRVIHLVTRKDSKIARILTDSEYKAFMAIKNRTGGIETKVDCVPNRFEGIDAGVTTGRKIQDARDMLATSLGDSDFAITVKSMIRRATKKLPAKTIIGKKSTITRVHRAIWNAKRSGKTRVDSSSGLNATCIDSANWLIENFLQDFMHNRTEQSALSLAQLRANRVTKEGTRQLLHKRHDTSKNSDAPTHDTLFMLNHPVESIRQETRDRRDGITRDKNGFILSITAPLDSKKRPRPTLTVANRRDSYTGESKALCQATKSSFMESALSVIPNGQRVSPDSRTTQRFAKTAATQMDPIDASRATLRLRKPK